MTLLPLACVPETHPSSAKKKESCEALNMPQIINTHAFFKVNKLFKKLTITVDAQNASLLLLNKLEVSRNRDLRMF
jgi:hypothetical protein